MNSFIDINIIDTSYIPISSVSYKPIGNIVDHSWYNLIQSRPGKPYSCAISVFSEIVYRLRLDDKELNSSDSVPMSKFSSNAWQTSYAHFMNKFKSSHETIRRALVKLEELGAIQREFRNIKIKGQIFNNILFISSGKNIDRFLSPVTNSSKHYSSPNCKYPYPQFMVHHISNKNIKKEYRSNESNFVKSDLEEASGREKDTKEILSRKEKVRLFTMKEEPSSVELVRNKTTESVEDENIDRKAEKARSEESIKTVRAMGYICNNDKNSEDLDKRISLDNKDTNNNSRDRGVSRYVLQDTDTTLRDIYKTSPINFHYINSSYSNAFQKDNVVYSNPNNSINSYICSDYTIKTIILDLTSAVDSSTTKTTISEASKVSNLTSDKEIKVKVRAKINEPSIGLVKKLTNKFGVNKRKPIVEYYPLNQEDLTRLNSLSGREFSLNYVNKLILKLGKEKLDHGFYTKELFLKYMAKILEHEMRQEINVNGETFRFKADAETSRVEELLKYIEDNRSTDKISHLKKKIAAIFEPKLAYRILTCCRFKEKLQDNIFQIELMRDLELSKHENKQLLQEVRGIFGNDVSDIEITKAKRIENNSKERGHQHQVVGEVTEVVDNRLLLELKMGREGSLWNKISARLLEHYGEGIHRSWFSRLEVITNEASTDITSRTKNINELVLKAPTTFFRDYVTSNYRLVIERFCKEEGLNYGEIYC